VQQVRGHDDRRAPVRALDDRRLHAADAERIEPGQRLVEEERAGLVEEAARDRELLLHAARELAGQHVLLVRELEFLEQRLAALDRALDLVEARGERQVLGHGQVVEQVGFVGQPREATLRLDRVGAEIVARRS
jgi:hypothetical protein